jgi:hypothetical protein
LGKVTLPHPLHDEAIRSNQIESSSLIGIALKSQPLDPGIELLRREFLFEPTQTSGPKFIHDCLLKSDLEWVFVT